MSTDNKNIILRCVAIDDEPFALRLIGDDISKVPFLKLVDSFSSPVIALNYLQKNPCDLLFLDIQMPNMLGTQFLRSLKVPPMVIMTTAYEQYAVEGFELDVLDYLLKPIPFDRLLKSVNKAREQFYLRLQASSEQENLFFFVRAEYKEIKIFYKDIMYVEGLKDYVKIFLNTQPRPVMTRMNLKAIESKLPPELFCRIHNSFIVPFSKISSFQRSQVFIGQTPIPVGDKYADDFRKRYGSEN
ncbi:MAG TPA: LytTR family DNA-binding domain-containing protein [Cyclobacteriaceae bacterium]|nr:LytTR family DNA-binding domain-containing protein [Cyclobacteriaceae bacterium]